MKLAIMVVGLFALSATSTLSQVSAPGIITVQGRLTDAAGVPLPAGTKDFVFRIYGAQAGGTLWWPTPTGEEQSIATDNEGLWTALVGSINPIQHTFLGDSVRWLEVTVDGVTLPRVRLATSPYSFRVASVDEALGGDIRSNVTIGSNNSASGLFAFAVGNGCTASNTDATVAGGFNNVASGMHSSIGGGSSNLASNLGSRVGGGNTNMSQGTHSVVGGGNGNSATTENSGVLGGYSNEATGSGSAVVGGGHNSATGINSFVGGGGGLSFEPLSGNSALGDYSTIVGGRDNDAGGMLSTIGGGWNNTATGVASSVLGGEDNRADGDSATVAGGSNNSAGGRGSAIGGGDQNEATGLYATIPGGRNNAADGNYSFAAGRRAEADHNGSFVWADNNDVVFHSSGPNQFLVRAEGGACLGDSVPQGMLHVTNNGPNSIALYLEGGTRDIAWASSTILQLGQWDGATFTERMRINSGGNVGIGTGTTPNILTLPDLAGVGGRGLANDWSTYSSRRWKDSIMTIIDPLDRISRLRGVTYVHKTDGKREIGLIAEEVGECVPEVVQYEANGVDAQSVNYSRLVALLIEGMKEQQREIETLKKRVDQLTQ